jgi:nitrogenase iron protein NifH
MRRIAVYGKGGIGKSTTSSNISDALAESGLKVMQIGCDPKADSTRLLTGNDNPVTVLDIMREKGSAELGDIVREGRNGTLCVECGGPRPGMGCAGRGIIAAFEELERLDAMDHYRPDVIVYDVLGDVVCGGFAAPIREGYAEEVLIVTSGEKMALYAANNIASAVENFADRSYARLRGVILNHRNVVGEDEKVRAFAESRGLEIVGEVPRSDDITRCEDRGMTTIEADPDLPVSRTFIELARTLMNTASPQQE